MALNHPLLSFLSAEPGETDLIQLEAQHFQDCSQWCQLFKIELQNYSTLAKRKFQLFRAVFPLFQDFCQHRFREMATTHLETLWQFWLPLALWLADRRSTLDRPWIQGILGGQGSGKTTLAAILALLLDALGYSAVSLSLDDLYKTHADRLRLKQQDPRLIWRGPPGTHEIELGIQTLDALRRPTAEPIAIPRFDKSLHQGSGDRVAPTLVTQADIVLFEGWFVGMKPIDPALFEQAPEPIVTRADRAFARDMNAHLVDYLPLWERLDSLIILHLADYRWSQQWRRQAEQTIRSGGKPGMTDTEIDAFVTYFCKALHPQLFMPPLIATCECLDLVAQIGANHQPRQIKVGKRFGNAPTVQP